MPDLWLYKMYSIVIGLSQSKGFSYICNYRANPKISCSILCKMIKLMFIRMTKCISTVFTNLF